MTIKVKTVYETKYMRDPDISEFNTKKEAEQTIKICKKWGIGIISCEIIKEEVDEN